MTHLWVPPGTVAEQPKIIGNQKTLDGQYVQGWKFTLTNPRNNRTQTVYIPADTATSDWELEQALGEAYENFIRDTDGLPAKVAFTPERRREIGRALRQVREARAKRAESTNGKIYY
jgi:hypothetical protein